jgi:hypothetical protein
MLSIQWLAGLEGLKSLSLFIESNEVLELRPLASLKLARLSLESGEGLMLQLPHLGCQPELQQLSLHMRHFSSPRSRITTTTWGTAVTAFVRILKPRITACLSDKNLQLSLTCYSSAGLRMTCQLLLRSTLVDL